jgi:HlyD family secretion protein
MSRLRVAAALLLLCGCFSGYESRSDSALRVHRGTFVSTLVLTGELEAQRGAMVSVPRLPSWETSVKWIATDGDAVRTGDRVAELDNTPFANDLDSKRQLATQAEQELQQKEAEWSADTDIKQIDLDKKKGDLEKAKIEAAMPPEIVSARDFEDRRMKLHRAQVDFDKARDILSSQQKSIASDRSNARLKLEQARRDVNTAEKAIDALILRAPRDGVVVIRDHPWEGRKLQAGDGVWVGLPVAQLPELDSLQINASLPDVDDGRLAVGMPALVTVDGYPSMHFEGRVASISPVAQERSRNELRRAFKVAVKLDRIDVTRMRPGLSARVEVRRERIANALLAPRGAIDFSKAGPRARLAGGRLVSVQLGSCNAQECVVRSGLEEGQVMASWTENASRG